MRNAESNAKRRSAYSSFIVQNSSLRLMMINGIIGRKIGMTQIFAADGTVTPVTVIKAGPCVVVQKKSAAGPDGYNAVQLGLVDEKPLKMKNVTKPMRGHFEKTGGGTPPTRILKEFRLEDSDDSMNVRAPGSIGASAYPSRVVKGMRSSGHMGDARITVKGLTIARVDAENNLLMVRGAVPGANGSVVIVKKLSLIHISEL